MIFEAENYRFDFPNAIDCFKFDECDRKNPNFHGAPMKGVDIIVEFNQFFLFIEIKDYDNPLDFDENCDPIISPQKNQDNYKWLKNYLKYKFRDTYLFRHAEEKVNKEIHYFCIINFDDALNNKMRKDLRRELPVGKASNRWKRELAKSCQVLNINSWNRNFSDWPLKKA